MWATKRNNYFFWLEYLWKTQEKLKRISSNESVQGNQENNLTNRDPSFSTYAEGLADYSAGSSALHETPVSVVELGTTNRALFDNRSVKTL